MSESDTDPAKAQWLWDEVPHYRLNDKIVHEYLSEHWEGYRFFIELRGEKFKFWVPRKLKEAERDELLARRIPKKTGK